MATFCGPVTGITTWPNGSVSVTGASKGGAATLALVYEREINREQLDEFKRAQNGKLNVRVTYEKNEKTGHYENVSVEVLSGDC